MHSPMGSGISGPMSNVGNGGMNVPLSSPMGGPGPISGPMSNGPINGMNPQMNGPLSNNIISNAPNGAIGDYISILSFALCYSYEINYPL